VLPAVFTADTCVVPAVFTAATLVSPILVIAFAVLIAVPFKIVEYADSNAFRIRIISFADVVECS
jgi:hypothetical protein